VLNEVAPTFIGMIEDAQPALAMSNIMLIPGGIEQRARAAKRVDKAAHAPVSKVARVVGAELCENVARAIFPPRNELARGRFKKHKTQEISLVVTVQPTAKKPGGRFVPATGVPQPVETVSGMANSGDGCKQGCRNIRIGPNIWMRTSGQFEQIVALGARQRQGARQSAQRFRRRLYRTSLFDPCAPGRADSGLCGEFFTPQAWGSPTAARFRRLRAFAVSADEFA
jgi:hypothetical protein